MSNLQRIHPFPDLESAAAGSPVPHPAAPLLPSFFEKTDPATTTTTPTPPAPPHCRFCRLLLTSLLLLFLLLVLLTAALLLVVHPKLPHYSITGLQVTNLTLSSSDTLSTTFAINVTAHNPNKRIGFYYEGGNRLSIWYDDATEICQGNLPIFYQGHQTTIVIPVALSGTTSNAAALVRKLRGSGGVTVVIKGKVKVKMRVKLAKLKFRMRKIIRVKCNSLDMGNDKINIKSSSCKIHL